MGDAQYIFDWISAQPLWWGLVIILVSAMIEYVFPPFPGDTVVVAAAMLIPNAGWPWWAVFAAIMAGSVVGAMAAFGFGRWLEGLPDDHPIARRMARPSVADRVGAVQRGFRKRGAAYILLNRFLPAFRSVFFVAAGLSGLPAGRVALFAALSALGWNALLMVAGWAVGYNLAEVSDWLKGYGVAVVVAVAATVVFWWLRRRLKKNDIKKP